MRSICTHNFRAASPDLLLFVLSAQISNVDSLWKILYHLLSVATLWHRCRNGHATTVTFNVSSIQILHIRHIWDCCFAFPTAEGFSFVAGYPRCKYEHHGLYPFYRLPSPLPFELAVHDDTAGFAILPMSYVVVMHSRSEAL